MNPNDSGLLDAAVNGDLEAAISFIDKGANIHIRTLPKDGMNECTALHLAAYKGNREMVALLLENGADRAMKTATYNCTPADLARQYHPKSGLEQYITNWAPGASSVSKSIRLRVTEHQNML